MTIGRLAEVLTEETGLLSTLRAPAEIPIDPIDLEAFLAAGDFAMAVVLHAFKCGDALDTLAKVAKVARRPSTPSGGAGGEATLKTLKVALVLGGTDVNVDAASSPARAATLARRAAAADVVVAFSPSMVAAAPSGSLPPATTVVVPQGVRLPTPREARRGQMFVDAPETFLSPEDSGAQSLFPSLHDALGMPSSTPVFLLPAGLRPVKDVLWAADAAEAAARRLAESRLCQSPGTRLAASASSPAFALAVVGPALDAAYASLVSEKARACSPSAGGAGAFASAGPVPRGVAVEYMRAAAGVLNTSASEGQSGALLEAAAAGAPVLARDIPGNRALLDFLEEAAKACASADTRAGTGDDLCVEDPEDPGERTEHLDATREISVRDDGGEIFGRDDALATHPRLAACAHPCGFLFAAPETLAEAMASFAEDSELGSAARRRSRAASAGGGATLRRVSCGGRRYNLGAARAAPATRFGSASPSTVSRCDGRRANDSRESTRRPERGSVRRTPSSDEATERILCITAVPRCTAVEFSFRFGGPSGAPKAVFRGFARHDGIRRR